MLRLRKSKKILRHIYHLYKKKRKKLNEESQKHIEDVLKRLQEAVLRKDRISADRLAQEALYFEKHQLKKTGFQRVRDFIFAIGFALIIAVLIRSMWFELYEIPTGSMRPTFKEKDRLIVSKTNFGVNIPLRPGHFYFDPDLIQRSDTFIFTGANMDIYDVDTLYFYIFPGKKQFVKRLMGKSGDTLYFYGGRIYGIDKDGNDISKELQVKELEKIDHVPFIHLDGKAITGRTPQGGLFSPVYIYQMNELVARLFISSTQSVSGEMASRIPSNPRFPSSADYYDLWGYKNYAVARLLNKGELQKLSSLTPADLPKGDLYLELAHHPSLKNGSVETDIYGIKRPTLGISKSYLPLDDEALRKLMDELYTARFIVKDNKAYRYGYQSKGPSEYAVKFEGVPNGTYEFYDGIAYQIYFSGITKALPKSHPIYAFSVERIQTLFNLGIEWDMRYAPTLAHQDIYPSRYAFFRDGDLYLMGVKTLEKEDTFLKDFLAREKKRQSESTIFKHYEPFIDNGPPLNEDGTINKTFLRTFGYTVPAGEFLALGDNYAMSADSRDFGCVPGANIRGAPSFIFYPPGPRFGPPNQPPYPWVNIPKVIVWSLAALIGIAWYIHHCKCNRLPLDFD